MMTLVSRSNVAILAGGYFLKALIVFTAELANVPGSTLLQLRMVFFVPGHELIEGLELPPADELFLGRLGDETTALPTTD